MKEVWKDIEGYEGLYQVSNTGRVKHLPYTLNNISGSHYMDERILKQNPNNSGYLMVGLYKNKKGLNKTVHRLVAKAFVENKKGLLEVNHRNEIKTDNRAENLEWVTHRQNSTHGTKIKRTIKTFKERGINVGENNPMFGKTGSESPCAKPILQYDMSGNLLHEYDSAASVERLFGYKRCCVNGAARGIYRQAYGFVWKYKVVI